MKISIFLGKDKSKRPAVSGAKAPATEMKGVPVRLTTFPQADRSSGAEAVVILTRGRVRSFSATAGEIKLYLSPRAVYRTIEPDAPEARPSDEPLTLCAACRDGRHIDCENAWWENPEDRTCECTSCETPFRKEGNLL